MKILRAIALLGALTGVIVYQSRQSPIFAAAVPPTEGSQADSSGSGATAAAAGAKVFQSNCAMCHGAKMEGHPPIFPTLAGVGKKMTSAQVTDLVRHGRNNMPAFSSDKLSDADLASLVQYLAQDPTFTPPASAPAAEPTPTPASPRSVAASSDPGTVLYQRNCAFCHGREAGGGESGPDLTRSKLVAEDVNGSTIGPVVLNGRAEGKMPKFNFSDVELASVVKFIHTQAKIAATRPGGRRGVDVADLQTGNVAAGKAYFEGAGNCTKCHSPSGDLAGVATRYEGLHLEEQMLYPRNAKDTLIVTLPSGEVIKGRLDYQDEFVVGLRDSDNVYHSWPVSAIKYTIDSPVSAHVDQFPKYTDDDIHNLMAYIQTLK